MTKKLNAQAVSSQAMELSPIASVATAKETKPWSLQSSPQEWGDDSRVFPFPLALDKTKQWQTQTTALVSLT